VQNCEFKWEELRFVVEVSEALHIVLKGVKKTDIIRQLLRFVIDHAMVKGVKLLMYVDYSWFEYLQQKHRDCSF
jgi:hypothetical protein